MKRKYSIGSFLFGLTIFIALLIQSIHSFHHIEEAFSKEHCHHDYSQSKHQITHSHEFDNCFTCQFAFSTSINSEIFTFHFKKIQVSKTYTFFHSREITQFFCGSLFALRAPPTFIV